MYTAKEAIQENDSRTALLEKNFDRIDILIENLVQSTNVSEEYLKPITEEIKSLFEENERIVNS